MNVTQKTRATNTGKTLPGKRDELLAKLFMGGIVVVRPLQPSKAA